MSDEHARRTLHQRRYAFGFTGIEWGLIAVATVMAAALSVYWVPITGVGFELFDVTVAFPFPSGLYFVGPAWLFAHWRRSKRREENGQ